MAKILITGSSGLIGTSLIEELKKSNNSIIRLVRKTPKQNDEIEIKDISKYNFDYVINLAGENIGDGRWTKTKKENIYNSRINYTKNIVEELNKCNILPKLFISTSAIGFYTNNSFLAKVCNDWESSAKKFKGNLSIIRIGVVLSPKGGALKKMILPFSLGLGATLGNGEQLMSWISLRDTVSSIIFIINNELSGTFDLVSPTPVSNKVFSEKLANYFNKKVYFKIPRVILNLLFGKEFSNEMLLQSFEIYPKELLKNNFKFENITIENYFAK